MPPAIQRILMGCAWALLPAFAAAQPATTLLPPPENVLNLTATASVEVPQDQITIRLSTSREAEQPTAVQQQLKAALDQALAELRPLAQDRQFEVRTGAFQVHPRYGRDGRIQAWTGTAEVILEGRDIQGISRAAAQVNALTVAGVNFGLSREQQQAAENRAQQQAIGRFQDKAGELARGFGFKGYGLREVTVQSSEQGPPPRPRMMALEARSASADSAIPVEPGKTEVQVTVSGSVQMRAEGSR